jgi:hypothetical protein
VVLKPADFSASTSSGSMCSIAVMDYDIEFSSLLADRRRCEASDELA